MSEHRLARRVQEVADRLATLRRNRRMSHIWLGAALVAGLLLAWQLLTHTSLFPAGLVASGVVLVVSLGIVLGSRAKSAPEEAALLIEQRFPDLDSRLLTAVEQRPDGEIGGYRFLQHEVISDALLHAHRHDWREAVPPRAMTRARLGNVASMAVCLAAFLALGWTSWRRPPQSSSLAGLQSNQGDESTLTVVVEPGDTAIERGTSLLVMARFDREQPTGATLVSTNQEGQETRTPMSRSLDDPVYGGRIAQVNDALTYRVEFDGRNSDDFHVDVFEFPDLVRADAIVEYPSYTGMAEKTVEDVRRVSVVEGSRLTLLCQLNKPVESARLTGDDAQPDMVLSPSEHDPLIVTLSWIPENKQTLELQLTDDAGRSNKHPPTFVIDVVPNNPPDLKISFPARDTRVTPLEELALEAQVWDDFGLKEFGLVYQTPGGDEHQFPLGTGAGGEEKRSLAHLMEFESLGAEPLQLVSYYFYADDIGPAGAVRRTFSDMYFAEVRHFEEIFRQNMQSAPQNQQQQQQSGAGQQIDELVQLQRQIVNATWNLIRRETGASPTKEFPADIHAVAEAQQQAIEQATSQQAEVEDPQAQRHLQEALGHMQVADAGLSDAASDVSIEPLPDARHAAQEAYQALLKLQSREHQVQQSQASSQSGQRAGQQQRQQQLNNLELKNNRNRYETESQDQQQQQTANREQLQVLNRLKELAQRQSDVNDKLKELEAALRMAETPEEREEIERQLKRLREEQQELLRDLDELQERMNQPQNRQQMSEAREQVEQTREQLRQTTEALEQGQASRALTSGTRAERELKQLEEDFRNQSANQFSEAMRQMRQEARDLDERQQELSDQLNERSPEEPGKQEARPSLREDKTQQQELESALAEQEQRLDKLLQQMEDTVRESEPSEPLLSKKLYDAIRKSRVDQPQESLAMTEELLRRGFRREATITEQQAAQGISTLRDGVEQAAESVLGNELDALRRAQAQLDQLANALGEELAANDPQSERSSSGDSQSKAQPGAQGDAGSQERQDQQPGNEPDPSAQQGGQSPSQNPPSEQSERQPGQSPSPGEQGTPSSSPSENTPSGQSPGTPSETGQRPGNSPAGQSQQGQSGQQPSPGNAQQGQEGQQGQSQPGGSSSQSQGGRQQSLVDFLNRMGGTTENGGGASGRHDGPRQPLTGSDFSQWSDQLRDVEEMLDDPDLRAEVAQVRDRARLMRIDVKTHSQAPNWELVRATIYGPMRELQDRLADEIARLAPDDQRTVPIDRDPVPDRYAEIVRRYYERLGAGQ